MQPAGLVDLVNGWGTTPRLEAGEQDWPYPPRGSLTGRLGLPEAAVPVTDQELTKVADRLYAVFAAESLSARVRLVGQLLAESAVCPALLEDGQSVREAWLVDDGEHALLAAAAVALRTHLLGRPADRLGVCSGGRCADVYIDASPAGRRRFCSLTCQNRARVAAFRRRRASEAEASSATGQVPT
jgi:predicted RNA-binding Zn ribbon-like protein